MICVITGKAAGIALVNDALDTFTPQYICKNEDANHVTGYWMRLDDVDEESTETGKLSPKGRRYYFLHVGGQVTGAKWKNGDSNRISTECCLLD